MSGHGSNYNKKSYELPQAVSVQKNLGPHFSLG